MNEIAIVLFNLLSEYERIKIKEKRPILDSIIKNRYLSNFSFIDFRFLQKYPNTKNEKKYIILCKLNK